ncbi:MAG TPA: hypothetical protein VHV49_16020 [Pseudonocardiaceae bacterium]|nr:hypothetical protein [Pseudonocardiaceae bacterium]
MPFNRRRFIVAGSAATAINALALTGSLGTIPERAEAATLANPSDIQFDVGAFIQPAQTWDGITFQMPPVNTVFLTAALRRAPDLGGQQVIKRALNKLENAYPWSAAGLITFVSYGLPYFQRLDPTIVAAHMPRLASDQTRWVLEEAVPSPKDVVAGNGITKLRYPVPVAIEDNDLVFTIRSDNPAFLHDAVAWLTGSDYLRGEQLTSPAFDGLLTFTSSRHMFVQQGMPRAIADRDNLPFAQYIQPDSPMWMGFLDQHTNGAGPPEICTFVGNASARLTTAVAGDYFDNGSIQHLSHNILDMLQWFAMSDANAAPTNDSTFDERVQYMFHSPPIARGRNDQFLNGGGPSILQNENRGPQYAITTAQGIGVNQRRVGHLSSLQRSSRAADGTPIHIRMDGPGYDDMDVPDGSVQPKLQFTIFVPTAEFFRTMRSNQAAVDLEQLYGMHEEDNGLERHITATRRQNFLVPPRRHRAFPLVELTS